MGAFFLQLISSVLGSVGFAILFKVRPKYLYCVVLGSALCFGTYYIFDSILKISLFAAAVFSTAIASLVAEVFARTIHAPALVFLIPSIVPIVPGGLLYKAMHEMIQNNTDSGLAFLVDTLQIGIGIACGIVIVSVALSAFYGIKKKKKRS